MFQVYVHFKGSMLLIPCIFSDFMSIKRRSSFSFKQEIPMILMSGCFKPSRKYSFVGKVLKI